MAIGPTPTKLQPGTALLHVAGCMLHVACRSDNATSAFFGVNHASAFWHPWSLSANLSANARAALCCTAVLRWAGLGCAAQRSAAQRSAPHVLGPARVSAHPSALRACVRARRRVVIVVSKIARRSTVRGYDGRAPRRGGRADGSGSTARARHGSVHRPLLRNAHDFQRSELQCT